MEQKKANDTKVTNMNELREEEKVTLKGVQSRFAETNGLLKDTNKKYNVLKSDYDELKVTYDKAIIKLQDVTRGYEELEKRHKDQTTDLNEEQTQS